MENSADCSSGDAHATKALPECSSEKEISTGSATSTANKTNLSIEVAVRGEEIADQSSVTGAAGSLGSVSKRGPLCSVDGCIRESQGLKCKGICQCHNHEKDPAAKSICTTEASVKSADEMVVERAIAASVRGRDSTILQTLTAVVESAGPMAIDVCSNFIRSYLMQKTCSDWSSLSCKTSRCTCMQTLIPDQIRSSATFVATTWCKMTQEEKVDQLALWIQQKGVGALPYYLPIAESSSVRPAISTNICRNALCAVLFVPTTFWKKAEERAFTLIGSKESSSDTYKPQKKMAEKAAATEALGTGSAASVSEKCSSNAGKSEGTTAERAAATGALDTGTGASMVEISSPSSINAQKGLASHSNVKETKKVVAPPVKSAPILMALENMVESAGLQAVEACSRYIRSYVMQQFCNDWVSSTRSRCVCAKTLTPTEICEAATYITTVWYKKSEEEKIAQLTLWIRQKKSGHLPFSLPSFQRVESTGEPKRLCRGAFLKLLFVSAFMWRKAEARASPSDAIDSEKKKSVCACDKPSEERIRVANYFGKTFPCSVTGCPNFSQSKCPGMCLSHFDESMAKRGMSVEQESGCKKVREVNAAAPARLQVQQAQIGTKKTRESRADNFSTTKPNGTITSVISKDTLSCRKDCAKKPTAELVANNVVKRNNQERTITPAPLFTVLLTKPMGITLLQKSGRIRVAAIETGSPAERSGKVSIGNVLQAVNGRDVTNMAVDDVVKMIKNGRSISDYLLFSTGKSAQGGDACIDAKYSNSQGHFQTTRKAEDLSNFFSALPISPRGKRGSYFHCSVEGCLKYSQRNCRGMCVSHFEESAAKDSVTSTAVDSTAAPLSASFVTPSPAKKGATNKCSIEGCLKYKQNKFNEMCRAHYLESQTKAENSIDKANSGRRRIEPRKPTGSQCGTCDACMVDECGECKHCLDMPRFGGKWKLRQKCLNRPACIVRRSLNSETTARTCNETDAKSARKSGGKRKRSSSAPTVYTPPNICVGEKIMKFFTDDFYEGKVERLPTKASSLFFVVYNDGDREELDEDGFWAAYSDYRVQKGMIEPSEFVPDSLVVANDGRLAVVRSFRPVSNGIDSTWSYRVHFTGWSTTFDKWMLEVDLRKQTKSTLKWAEKVRTSLGIKDRSKKKMKREGDSSASAPKSASNGRAEEQEMRETTQRNRRGDLSYPLRSVSSPETKKGASLKKILPTNELKHSLRRAKVAAAESISTKRPTKATKAKSIPSKSIGCDVVMRQYPLRSTEPHLRRAAVDAKRKISTTQKDVPKQAKKSLQRKNLSSKPRRTCDKKENMTDVDTYILPAIVVGTSILKYFVEGKDYFEGKITKLPTRAKNFYRIRYQDGDEEDMGPLELYMAFSDWCVANNEIPLTKVRNAITMVCCISFVWTIFNSHHIISLFISFRLRYSYYSSIQISTCMPLIAVGWSGKLLSSPFAPYSSQDACLENGPGPTVSTLSGGINGMMSGWTRTAYEK